MKLDEETRIYIHEFLDVYYECVDNGLLKVDLLSESRNNMLETLSIKASKNMPIITKHIEKCKLDWESNGDLLDDIFLLQNFANYLIVH